jgi:manganese/zinc/iron transport system ATP- binding protein
MKTDMPLALDVRGLMVHYGSSPIVWDLHLSVPTGHLVGIMGPNGAGKTTFIKAILGLLEGTTGVVRLMGHKLDAIRRKVAYVPQRERVDWDFPMTVRDLVEMGCYPKRGLFRSLTREDHQRVENALELLGLSSMAKVQIGQLSGGQQQRAFVSRAIAQDAELYFLDEPFEGIDQVSEHILVDVLRSLRSNGKTIFVVHHDLVTAGKYFDWAIFLNTRLVSNGPMCQVFTSENLYLTYGKNLAIVEEVVKILSAFAEGRAVHGGS